MVPADEFLSTVTSALLIDWPSRDVPDTLVRAGWTVAAKGGPEPDNYSTYEVVDGEVVARPTGRRPEHVDLVYAYRPLSELPAIIDLARSIGARGVWLQSGRSDGGSEDPKGCWLPAAGAHQAKTLVEAAGLVFFASPYLADAIRVKD